LRVKFHNSNKIFKNEPHNNENFKLNDYSQQKEGFKTIIDHLVTEVNERGAEIGYSW